MFKMDRQFASGLLSLFVVLLSSPAQARNYCFSLFTAETFSAEQVFSAIEKGDSGAVSEMIPNFDINAVNPVGTSVLRAAIWAKSAKDVQALLQRPELFIDPMDLFFAYDYGSVEVFRAVLASKRYNLNAQDPYGNTLLHRFAIDYKEDTMAAEITELFNYADQLNFGLFNNRMQTAAELAQINGNMYIVRQINHYKNASGKNRGQN